MPIGPMGMSKSFPQCAYGIGTLYWITHAFLVNLKFSPQTDTEKRNRIKIVLYLMLSLNFIWNYFGRLQVYEIMPVSKIYYGHIHMKSGAACPNSSVIFFSCWYHVITYTCISSFHSIPKLPTAHRFWECFSKKRGSNMEEFDRRPQWKPGFGWCID